MAGYLLNLNEYGSATIRGKLEIVKDAGKRAEVITKSAEAADHNQTQ